MSERDTHDDDPDRLADELEHGADQLQDKAEALGDEIDDARQDWEAKRRSNSVPGAEPMPADSDRDAPGDSVNPEDADR
jgi:hypothetical protein